MTHYPPPLSLTNHKLYGLITLCLIGLVINISELRGSTKLHLSSEMLIELSNNTHHSGIAEHLVLDSECDFLITKTTCLPDGQFEICVEANDFGPGCLNQWIFSRFGFPDEQDTGAKVCKIFNDLSAGLTIEHCCSLEDCCLDNVQSIECNPDCSGLNFDYSVENCLATVNFELISGVVEAVVDWGDGSPAQSVDLSGGNPFTMMHSYPTTGGTFEVCITWRVVLALQGGDPNPKEYSTCCFDIVVDDCINCVGSFVTWSECVPQDPDECCIDLEFITPHTASSFYWEIFEGGTGNLIHTQTTTDKFLTRNFIGRGPYQVCVTIELAGQDLRCCTWISLPPCECCESADFELEALVYSCQKNAWRVTPECDDVGITRHKWIFEDGTEFEGLIPPPHIFTDFVNDDGQVCITHQIICDGVIQDEVTKCGAQAPGAYLGELGSNLNMSDILSNLTSTPTVYQFILDATNNGTPLFIEGDLTVDIDVSFVGGVWNMGNASTIIVDKKQFNLDLVQIRSAARLGTSYAACCRWTGIQAEPGSSLTWSGAFVHDAEIMLHLLESGSSDLTSMSMVGCYFETNVVGILWENHRGAFSNFHNNHFNNPANCAGTVCGCCYTIAIDLDNVSWGVTFPLTASIKNSIHGYQHGIRATNTRLNVQNFLIENLREDAISIGGNGIWFIKDIAPTRVLTMDHMQFDDMQRGVRYEASGGGFCGLSANASATHTSITMDNVHYGYDIDLNGTRMISGAILGNLINTNGGTSNFGVRADISASNNNRLSINNNLINANGGLQTLGISLTTNAEATQVGRVRDNVITNNANNDGAGIYVDKWLGTHIVDNVVTLSNQKPGIEVIDGGFNLVQCNTVIDGDIGIRIYESRGNDVIGNTLFDNKTSMWVVSDCNTAEIKQNTFDLSTFQSNYYEGLANTTAQTHEDYNFWNNQNNTSPGNEEVYLVITSQWPLCYFWAPAGSADGDLHHPWSDPGDMFDDAGGVPVYSDPCSPGGGGSDPGTGTGLVVPGDLSQMLSDPATMGAATPAARTSFEISVFDQILQNIWWRDSFPVLDSFYLANETAFIGEISQLYSEIRTYTDQLDAQLTAIENDLATIDLLGQQMDSLGGLLVIETDPGTITQLNQQILTLMSQKDAIELGVTNSQSQYDSQNDISLGSLVNQLNGVSTSQTWESDEKEVIRLHLEVMQGNGLLPGDLSFLRSMASTCWRDAGRGVYLAQALLLSTTGEYYNQSLCAPATGALLSNEEVGPSGWSFSLLPNPAKEYVEVQFIGDRNEGEIDILIHDMKGHQVFAQPSMGGSIRIETTHLLPGVYFVRLTQQGESAVKPLIIVK